MRTIDRVLAYVDTLDGLSPIEKEVLRYRIELRPDAAELEQARIRLSPHRIVHADGWQEQL